MDLDPGAGHDGAHLGRSVMPHHQSNASGLTLAALLGPLACEPRARPGGGRLSSSCRHNRWCTVKALLTGNELLRVRLSWIDAPEKSQAFGQRSKQHLSELVFGRDVELYTYGLDRYGRTLAVVILNGVDINLEQVRSGMAWVYDRYVVQAPESIRASYRQAEAEAWEQQRGLWSERDQFRRGNIGALARKETNFPAIQRLEGKDQDNAGRVETYKGSSLVGARNIALSRVGKINMASESQTAAISKCHRRQCF
jgi:endonuclease YncB( thermonuclease family)